MGKIIPRWEWRTFGSSFGRAEASFEALTPSSVQASDELYLLAGPDSNVKIRDDLMDIKILREIDASGLQRWEPIAKAAFPLDRDQAGIVFGVLGHPTPPDTPDPWALQDLLSEVAGPHGRARAVPVHKRRVRYTVEGCTAEMSEVSSGSIATKTIAIESEDADAVVAAVRSVGLEDYLNVSYPAGLVHLVDGTPERFAVVDVGTNSIKSHIAERGVDGSFRTVLDRAEVTRLGEAIAESGTISDEALERSVTALSGMAEEAHERRVRAIAAVGTAGLRRATNRDAVIAEIRTRTGLVVEVISGDEESRLAYLAVAAGFGLESGSAVVFDTGGGSSQFTFGHSGTVDERFSVDVGAVRITERYALDGVVSAAVVEHARHGIAAELGQLNGRARADLLVGMGGAITNLTAVALGLEQYDGEAVHGAKLSQDEIDRQISMYRELDAASRRSIVGLQPKRAEVILAGACIVRTVMDLLGHTSLTVSDRGLRHGVLQERFGAEAGG